MPAKVIIDARTGKPVTPEAVGLSQHAREKSWNEIERKHLGRCLWQQRVGNGTILVECMWFPRVNATILVCKHFDKPIPRSGSGKPWPELTACYVYAPIGGNTWESLDQALADLSTEEAA